VDLAKVTANVNIDTGPLTSVQEDELVADKQYLDPIAFIEIKAEVEVSYTILPCFLPRKLCEGISSFITITEIVWL
jgi:hypothetical protein